MNLEQETDCYKRIILPMAIFRLEMDGSPCTPEKIKRELITCFQTAPFEFKNTHEWVKRGCRELETVLNISMTLPAKLDAGGTNWYTNSRKEQTANGYWERYVRWIKSQRSSEYINSLDKTSDEILNLCGDPKSTTLFQKKGLVIGDVQSGKTSNYTALICKAADAGYRIIVVIAGILNNLRYQTQSRLEEAFVGKSSDDNIVKRLPQGKYGVSQVVMDPQPPDPQVLTWCSSDFKKELADGIGPDFKNGGVILLVIKKNTRTLANLLKYMKSRIPQGLRENLPLLLIDDEADNASVNSNKPNEAPTVINRKIRELLALFAKSTYIGYTATPYANIFINPYVSGDANAAEDRMQDQDLFPKDFIYCLGRPSNYIGAMKLFGRSSNETSEDGEEEKPKTTIVQTIDEEDLFLEKLKKETAKDIPQSMKEAIYAFVLTRAIRNIRNEREAHCTMLINVTHKRNEHRLVARFVKKTVTKLKAACTSICLKGSESLNEYIYELHLVWSKHYKPNINISWDDIRKEMGRQGFMDNLAVKTINTDSDAKEKLDYEASRGQFIIAVGGNSLSRGLTLEGLTISYFLRSARQYDTLMQMGRWFGYRDGYADLCKVFLTGRMQVFFAAIANATDELKESIRVMRDEGSTPLEYGLRVRNDINGLLVTAPNKMNSTYVRREWTDCSGRLFETYEIPSDDVIREKNNQALIDFLDVLFHNYNKRKVDESQELQCGIIWEDVSTADVRNYLKNCWQMKAAHDVDTEVLAENISKMETIDVCFIQRKRLNGAKKLQLFDGINVTPLFRVPGYDDGSKLGFKHARFFTRKHEMGHITKEQAIQIKQKYLISRNRRSSESSANSISMDIVPGMFYRELEGRRPLMLVAFAWIPDKDIRESAKPTADDCTKLATAFGFSFPTNGKTKGCYTKWVYNAIRPYTPPVRENDYELGEDYFE